MDTKSTGRSRKKIQPQFFWPHLALVWLFMGCSSSVGSKSYTSAEEASVYPGFSFQGEYVGLVQLDPDREPIAVGLQLAVVGENLFRGRLYYGGLPGKSLGFHSAKDVIELNGRVENEIMRLAGEGGLRFRGVSDRLTAFDQQETPRGELERVQRESPTLGMNAPEGAVVLFDGSNLDPWSRNASMSEEGWLEEGATTAEKFGDIRLHVEVKLPFMPESENQQRGNSGIYLQNRYEVQLLDSFAQPPAKDGNASLYRQAAPMVNASYPPLSWQTYDVYFRAPNFGPDGGKTENARITVYLNGVLVQDDLELAGGTGVGRWRAEVPRAEIYLQDHSDPVRFRNIWLVEEDYSPPK